MSGPCSLRNRRHCLPWKPDLENLLGARMRRLAGALPNRGCKSSSEGRRWEEGGFFPPACSVSFTFYFKEFALPEGSKGFLHDTQLVADKLRLQGDGIPAEAEELLLPSHKVGLAEVAEADARTLRPVALVVDR